MKRRTKFFAPMGTFANRSWLPSGKNLDGSLKGLVRLPMEANQCDPFAVIRRWTSPRDWPSPSKEALVHPTKDGDGVQGTIVSSRSGQLGSVGRA